MDVCFPYANDVEIEALMSNAESIVRKHFRLAGPLTEHADLVQEGVVGALRAARRWSPDKGACLTTFAYPRTYGAVQDYLRQVKPGARTDSTEYEVLSIDLPMGDGEFTLADTLAAEEEFRVDPFLKGAICEALSRLNDEERLVIELAYFEGWTRKQIGEHIGRTEGATFQFMARTERKLAQDPALQDFRSTATFN